MYMYMIIYMLQCHIIYYVWYPMYIYDICCVKSESPMVHHQPPRPLTGLNTCGLKLTLILGSMLGSCFLQLFQVPTMR